MQVAIRNIRRDAIDAIKKKGKEDGISEDEVKGYQDDVQKKTDEYIKKIDVAIEEKIKRNNDSIIKYQILENKRRPVFPLFSVKGD